MKCPGRTDYSVEQAPIWLRVVKETEHAISRDGQNAVDRKKIWRQRDQKIVSIRHDMPAITPDAKTADPATEEQNAEGMSQLVAKYIDNDRAWQAEERDQTKDCA